MAETPLKIKFGAVLKEYLQAAGKPQKEMAELLGISGAAVSQVLHGKNTFNQKQLDAVIEWLHLNRSQSSQLTAILTQIRSGETQIRSPFNKMFFALRCEHKFSVPTLAEKTGLSYARILQLEKDHKATPLYDEAVRLAQHLGCRAVELLSASEYNFDDLGISPDRDAVTGGVAENTGTSQASAIPLLPLDVLKTYKPDADLLEFGCLKGNKVILYKNEHANIPVIAVECSAQKLALNFPGTVRLLLGSNRPEDYNFFNLCFTQSGNFGLLQKSGRRTQVFRTAGITRELSEIVWSLPVLELKMLPVSLPESGEYD